MLSHDQRLKIFATLSQQITQDVSETQQMNVTAIAFPAAAASAKSASAAAAAASSSLIALGTKSGEIVLWNLAKGCVDHTLSGPHKHTGAVHSLAFSTNGSSLFSVAADRSGVKQWSVTTGAIIATFEAGEDADTASGGSFRHVCVSPDGSMLLAGGTGSLLLWSMSHSGSPLRDYQGPTDRISCVAFSPDSKYIVSGAADRYLSLWSAESDSAAAEDNGNGSKKSAKKAAKKSKATSGADKNTPIHTFTLQTAPISVQFNTFAAKGVYQIAALSDSSIVSILQWSPAGSAASGAASTSSSGASSTPVSVISVPHSSVQSESSKRRDESHKSGKAKGKSTASSSTLLAGEEGDAIGAGVVQSMQFQSPRSILLARGDAVRPLFQTVSYAAEDGSSFDAEITLPKFQHAHLINAAAVAAAAGTAAGSEKKRKAGSTAVHSEPVTLGAQHTADRVQTAQSGLDGDAAPKRAKLASAKSKSDALSRSLADRLAESEAAAASSLAAGSSAFNLSAGALPKAGSLQTILQQALHSHDAALVEYCLTAGASASSSGHASLIRVTVRRLAPVYILPLLQHLMQKFATRPNRAAALLPWLREIFNAHTAYLIRQPNLSTQLAPLSHLLDQRSAVFKKMIKLQARLDLLLGQIAHTHSDTRGAADDASEQDGQTTGALLTFNDGEDDDEEDADHQRDDEDDEGEGEGEGEDNEEDHDDEEEEEDEEEGDEHMDDEEDEQDE